MFAEQPLRGNPFRVQDVHQRDSILGETGSEDYHFKVLAHFFDELATARSYLDVDLASAALDIDR